MGPTHMGTGDRVAGKHLPASTVFRRILAPWFLFAVLQQLSSSESKHREMEIRLSLPGMKRMGMSHVGLCWAGGDWETGSCCSLSLCCSLVPKRGRDNTPLPPAKVTLAQRDLGASRRECFTLGRLAAPQNPVSLGLCLCGAAVRALAVTWPHGSTATVSAGSDRPRLRLLVLAAEPPREQPDRGRLEHNPLLQAQMCRGCSCLDR